MYSNVQGIKSKRNSLINIFEELSPKIALITETQLTEGSGIKIEGYTFFGKAREKKAGGGVGIFVDNEIKHCTAPHINSRNLEIIWISITRKNLRPLFVGVYYGKQESEGTKADIEAEIGQLTEEILEVQQEGEMILFMDANAKIGLMKEPVSRNGKLLLKLIQETSVKIINGSQKCKGSITRQNRRKLDEKSAIDLVMASYGAEEWIMEMEIDEDGIFRPKGKNETDHNTIVVKMDIKDIQRGQDAKNVVWNVKAPKEKWDDFRRILGEQKNHLGEIMEKPESMDTRYGEWEKTVWKIGMDTIGRTTIKDGGKEKFSENVEKLRKERRMKKKQIGHANDAATRYQLTSECIKIQEDIKEEIAKEKREKIEGKLKEVEDKNAFWRERKKMKKDQTLEWLITKDGNGKRIYGPEENKNNMATYYETLYMKQDVASHVHHAEVLQNMEKFERDRENEDEVYNSPPSIEEVTEAIRNKKGGKSTTDFKNEMVKGGSKQMVEAVMPVIEAVWREEVVPHKWNQGIITSLWKGKGDREDLKKHRGITVSSAFGTIPEVIMNDRFVKHLHFTQAQAGGRKNCSTSDHVFLVRAITEYALKAKKKIFITFFDVAKAFDHADVDDMFNAAWKGGIRGKLWRLAKKFQENLTARVKTRYGTTRIITRECGGKQGGHIMPTIFAKLMDTLAEDLLKEESIGAWIKEVLIPALLFMDDATTIAEGVEDQERMLERISDFATQHKMEWGVDKCKVMQIGRGKNLRPNWKLGEKVIDNADDYKYLGDYVSRNGTNKKNLEERGNQVHRAMRAIKSCAQNELMEKIQNQVILRLHETVVVPTLLTNAESWTLTASEEKLCDQIEAGVLKSMFGLPQTFPNSALIFATGSLYASIRIDQKRFLFLHKILTREADHWTRHMLKVLDDMNTGWPKNIREKLEVYDLEKDWDNIRKIPKAQWKSYVKKAAENRNKERIINDCHHEDGRPKEKTKHLIEIIKHKEYKRKPGLVLQQMNRNQARIVLIARYGMLDCANNYSHKYGSKLCKTCNNIDDESHRINGCKGGKQETTWIDFKCIYKDDTETLNNMVKLIAKKWGLKKY